MLNNLVTPYFLRAVTKCVLNKINSIFEWFSAKVYYNLKQSAENITLIHKLTLGKHILVNYKRRAKRLHF